MRASRSIALGAAALATALLLSGCLDTGFPGKTPSVPAGPTGPSAAPSTSPSASPSTSPSPTAAPSPTEEPGDTATPVHLDCGALLPIAALYDIDPNLGAVPLSGSPSTRLAQDALAADGTVCQVTHATSGATAFISIAAPGAAAIDAAIAAAGPGSPLGDTGLEAHGDAAQLVVVSGDHLVGGECDPAFNPESLRALVALAIAGGA